MALANLTQEQTDMENRDWCKRIAEKVERYANGEIYRCPDCGDDFHMNPDHGDKYRCPHCGAVAETDEYEQLSIFDYIADCLDIRYLVSSAREVIAVKILVAFGGPNIWIDTETRQVELYWWTDRASYPISKALCDELEMAAQELFNADRLRALPGPR